MELKRLVAGPILRDGLKVTVPVFTAAIVFSFFINLLLFVSPLYMLQVYDRVLSSRNETTLYGITIAAAFAIAVYAVLEMLRSRILVRAGILFDEQIAGPIFAAVHRGNMLSPEGNYFNALRDVDIVRDFLTGSGLLSFCDAPWTPIFLVACFILHPWFGWMAIVGGLVLLGLTILNEVATKRELSAAATSANAAALYAQAVNRNGEVLQAMGMVDALRRLWGLRHSEVLDYQALASDRAGLIVALTKFTRMFLQTMILGVGAYLAIHREISAGSMIAASIIMGRALAPVEMIVGNWKGFSAVRASYRRLNDLVAVAGEESIKLNLPRPSGRIDAENLIVMPPGKKKAILRGVTFGIDAGSIVGIVGPSAAGKSTLARALTGVWPVGGGSLRIDGAELSHWDPQTLGRYVGYLPQDVELFAGSVADNIARFQEVEDQAVVAVAQRAGCHDLIQNLTDGYNTQIGIGGYALSGGQRQRIALARAMYGNPSLVVLDEPNASLDAAGEEALMRAVRDMKTTGSTVILVTHKVNILMAVDVIIVVNAGVIQAYGPRDEILGQVAGPRIVASTVPPQSNHTAQRNAG